jgi:tetratricopeptide (TPR) repeat protein
MIMQLNENERLGIRCPHHWRSPMRRSKRMAITLVWALVLASLGASTAWAVPYGNHDVRQLVVPASKPGAGGSFNLAYFDRMLSDLSAHAGNYPPQFDSPGDMQRAQRDTRQLMGMLHAAFGKSPPDALLLRMAALGSIGHNLEITGGAEFAQTHFERALRANADDPLANYHYGSFLAGSARPREALPYLQKARDKGVTPALYAIGLAQLSLGDKSSALAALNEYMKRNPSDQRVRGLVDAIRGGKLEIQPRRLN